MTSASRVKAIAIGALGVGAAAVALPVASAANVIYNGGFGHGLRGWQTVVVARGIYPGYPRVSVRHTPPRPILKCRRARRGRPYLQMDVPGGANAYVEQSIIVPVRPGRLTVRAWGDLEPVRATVSIVNGPRVNKLISFLAPQLRAGPSGCSGRRPVTESLSMSRYAGQAVGLRIQATAQGPPGALVDFDQLALAGG